MTLEGLEIFLLIVLVDLFLFNLDEFKEWIRAEESVIMEENVGADTIGVETNMLFIINYIAIHL